MVNNCFIIIVYISSSFGVWGGNSYVKSDIDKFKEQIELKIPYVFLLLYFLHNNAYFRSLFYYRIGPIKSLIIGWYRPGDKYFLISYTTKIGRGMLVAHPYATVINADIIGDNCGRKSCKNY